MSAKFFYPMFSLNLCSIAVDVLRWYDWSIAKCDDCHIILVYYWDYLVLDMYHSVVIKAHNTKKNDNHHPRWWWSITAEYKNWII